MMNQKERKYKYKYKANKIYKTNKTKQTSKYYDLNVSYPKYKPQLQSIIERLEATHYSVIALTYTIYGKVRCDKDESYDTMEIPKSSSMQILKRLNIIIEELSDLSYYTDKKHLKVLDTYDLISFTPRTEAIFTALISSSHSIPIDIIVLDYNCSFPLRHTVINESIERGIGLELCYSPALADVSKRKHWIKMAYECKQQLYARMNTKPIFLLCSGMRWINSSNSMNSINGINSIRSNQRDLGSMVLRSPQDIINVYRVVWQWESNMVHYCMTMNPNTIIQNAKKRRFGYLNHQQRQQQQQQQQHQSTIIAINYDSKLNMEKQEQEEDGFLHFE